MKITHLKSLLIWLLLLFAAPVLAQGGGGDLPPVPKATTKPKPKPTTSKAKTPASKASAKSAPKLLAAKEPANIEDIAFDQLVESKIDAQTAGRIPPNVYYQEFRFTGTDADLFEVQVNSPQAAVKVELLDANKISLPFKRDEASGLYRLNTDGFILPSDGTYRVRVSVAPSPALTAPVPFTLKLIHTGLTAAGYQFRLQQIVKGFSPQKPDESIAQLERLAQDDPKKPGAHEYLGLLYNEFKKDQVKASAAMLQAIKLGGAAIFKVAHDSQWRRPNRDRQTQRFAFPDLRTNWLRVSATQLVIADFNLPDKALLTFPREQLKEVNRVPPSAFMFFKHDNKKIKPDTITLGFNTVVEADIAVDLIKGNLLRKD
jgi:hypothetical protein